VAIFLSIPTRPFSLNFCQPVLASGLPPMSRISKFPKTQVCITFSTPKSSTVITPPSTGNKNYSACPWKLFIIKLKFCFPNFFSHVKFPLYHTGLFTIPEKASHFPTLGVTLLPHGNAHYSLPVTLHFPHVPTTAHLPSSVFQQSGNGWVPFFKIHLLPA
jgi:hypothetical protein